MFKRIIIIFFLLLFPLLASFFLAGCGSCTLFNIVNDSKDKDEDEETNYYTQTATMKGSLSMSEVEKMTPPTTPLPQSIAVTSIITRSDLLTREDIITRSDFIFKMSSQDSSETTLNDDETFNLTVPVGYEFISLIEQDGEILGLIKFKKGEKYVANLTLPQEKNGSTIEIGSLYYNSDGDYFSSEKSPFETDGATSPDEELTILINNTIEDEPFTFDVGLQEVGTIDISVQDETVVAYKIVNIPGFCTLLVYEDEQKGSAELAPGSARLVCSTGEDDAGIYKGILLSATYGTKKGYFEIIISVDSDGGGESEYSITSVAVGAFHTCVVLKNGKVKCWGINMVGELGFATESMKKLPYLKAGKPVSDTSSLKVSELPYVDLGKDRKAVGISAGGDGNSTCVILDDGDVKCWGQNTYGELGLGDTLDRGDTESEMGDNLPAVNLGAMMKAKSISSCYDHACAILSDDSIKCWGNNFFGQLGLGDQEIRGNDLNDMGDNLPRVSLGEGLPVQSITCGNSFTCALLGGSDSTLKCWGTYQYLGIGATSNQGDNLIEMGNNLPALELGSGKIPAYVSDSCVILTDESVKCWGNNSYGQIGLGDKVGRSESTLGHLGDTYPAINLGSGRKVKQLASSSSTRCVILDNYDLKCWGFNGYGQLGYGDTTDRGDSSSQMGDNLPNVDLGMGRYAIKIAVGYEHICALLDNYTLKCWGYNSYGQLGLGDTEDRGDESNEMGDNLPIINY